MGSMIFDDNLSPGTEAAKIAFLILNSHRREASMKRLSTILTGAALLTLAGCMASGYPPGYSYPVTSPSSYPGSSGADYRDYNRSGYGPVGYNRSTYGVIESISVAEPNSGIGVGAVAGGVVGGLLGHQIGKGKGNTVATIAGTVGGAYAGHQIEKSLQSGPVYQMTVRMEDGSYQTVTQDANTPLRVGDRIRVVDGKVYPL
jgi:outer membrane lipoprotein SlyB